ncbi:hypothetical protein [Leuconostoc fallax]|uniref:hypothetical protein n=1 Tax=Leuconostoc fallax TaxID=1251 RepID=UPI001C1EFA68|nr:hypothetical protein [Leuconostoc fallax]MBU7455684.1 hypothetical protein [Leuconostoc fallax]
MYLTYSEYKAIGLSDIEEKDYVSVEMRAEIQIDSVTNFFYTDGDDHDLNIESASTYKYIKRRALAFKRAMAIVIDYMVRNDVLDSSDIADGGLTAIEMGETHLTASDSGGVTSSSYNGLAVPKEALLLLGANGLRYGGVSSV